MAMDKPTIPEVIDRFRAYHAWNLTWGSLHIVLDDGNVDDDSVAFCKGWALEHGDAEGNPNAVTFTVRSTALLVAPW